MLVDWRSAGVAVSLMQVVKNFTNDFVLGNKANHAQRTATITYQRIDLIDPFDELRPTFSESGPFFFGESSGSALDFELSLSPRE